MRYFNGLNGLRCIAALGVLLSHLTYELDNFDLDPGIFGRYADGSPVGLNLASYGVTIFFTLSGFLITFLLLEEKSDGPISVPNFYARRILRIWPLYYLYILAALFIILLFHVPFDFSVLPYYIFFTANIPMILHLSQPLIGHYWSLGVEEQFYLLWPLIVKKAKHIEITSVILLSLLFFSKLFFHYIYPVGIVENILQVCQFDCILAGSVAACWYRRNDRLFLKLTDNKITQAICWLVLLLIILNRFSILDLVNVEIVAGVTVCLVVGQINRRNRIINLENRVMNHLGKISYGIYVLHPLVILLSSFLLKELALSSGLKYILVFSTVTGVTILLAHLSYTYFESYFLAMKTRYRSIRKSPAINAGLS